MEKKPPRDPVWDQIVGDRQIEHRGNPNVIYLTKRTDQRGRCIMKAKARRNPGEGGMPIRLSDGTIANHRAPASNFKSAQRIIDRLKSERGVTNAVWMWDEYVYWSEPPYPVRTTEMNPRENALRDPIWDQIVGDRQIEHRGNPNVIYLTKRTDQRGRVVYAVMQHGTPLMADTTDIERAKWILQRARERDPKAQVMFWDGDAWVESPYQGNPADGYHVMKYGGGRYTSVSWHPTQEEAEREVARIKMVGGWSGMPPKVEPSIPWKERGIRRSRLNPWYVGYRSGGEMDVFHYDGRPTADTHGHLYLGATGPWETRESAEEARRRWRAALTHANPPPEHEGRLVGRVKDAAIEGQGAMVFVEGEKGETCMVRFDRDAFEDMWTKEKGRIIGRRVDVSGMRGAGRTVEFLDNPQRHAPNQPLRTLVSYLQGLADAHRTGEMGWKDVREEAKSAIQQWAARVGIYEPHQVVALLGRKLMSDVGIGVREA